MNIPTRLHVFVALLFASVSYGIDAGVTSATLSSSIMMATDSTTTSGIITAATDSVTASGSLIATESVTASSNLIATGSVTTSSSLIATDSMTFLSSATDAMGPTASAVANILQFEVAAAADPFQASLVYSTPKFQQKWIMAFTLHPNTDYQRGIQNPGIIDELSSAQDLKSCLQACTTVNMNSPVLYQGNANPPCNGLVFKEGYCWLKSGINETSVYDSDSTAYAAILHLLE